MIKYNTNYIKKLIEKFGIDEVSQLRNMNKEERDKYYDHFYHNTYCLSPSLWLFRQREKSEYMSYVEIAKQLNTTPQKVKTIENRAFKKMFSFLKQKNIILEDYL